MLHRKSSLLGFILVVALAASVVNAQAARTETSSIDDQLATTLSASKPGDPIVVFVHSATIQDAVRATESAGLELIERWTRVGIAVAFGVPSAIRRLGTDPSVLFVEPNQPVQLLLDTAHSATRAEDARDAGMGLLDPAGMPYDGSGVTIAINDTGIDGTHEMFMQDGSSKVVRNLRHVCVYPDPCDEWIDVEHNDDDGHGTAVAGVAAGFERLTLNGRRVRGVAPGARLVGLGTNTYTQIYGHLSGLNWVLENHQDPCSDGSCPAIRVVSNSWGTLSNGALDEDSAVTKLSDQLVAAGIVVTFAISNNGGDGSTDWTMFAAHNPTPGVIGVAAYDDADSGTREHGLWSSSSRALRTDPTTYPDLAAPGAGITTACSVAQNRCHPNGDADPSYSKLWGTSFASPYVAGAAALLFEADPSLTPAQVEYLLENTAYQFGTDDYVADPRNPDHTTSFDRGHGLIDVAAALAAALSRPLPYSSCGSVVDDRGDARDVSAVSGLPGEVSEEGLDLTAAQVSTDPSTGALSFAIRLADLSELPPSGAVSESLQFHLTYRDVPYELHLERHGGAAEVYLDFRLQTVSRQIVSEDLEGRFDQAQDLVTVVVPANSFHAWDPAIPVLQSGDVVSGLWLTANRSYGISPVGPAYLTADSASSNCDYVVGS